MIRKVKKIYPECHTNSIPMYSTLAFKNIYYARPYSRSWENNIKVPVLVELIYLYSNGKPDKEVHILIVHTGWRHAKINKAEWEKGFSCLKKKSLTVNQMLDNTNSLQILNTLYFYFEVLGIEPRTSLMLGKWSTTELHSQSP